MPICREQRAACVIFAIREEQNGVAAGLFSCLSKEKINISPVVEYHMLGSLSNQRSPYSAIFSSLAVVTDQKII